jgi:hypothetical protein
MQLRLKPRGPRSLLNRSLVIKTILFAVIFLSVIILLDKINMPTPTKLIKQKVSNDKLITLK